MQNRSLAEAAGGSSVGVCARNRDAEGNMNVAIEAATNEVRSEYDRDGYREEDKERCEESETVNG